MALQILILLAGLALVVLGADWLVDGSSAIARKAGLSEFVIGLTIVAAGTSAPELFVSLVSALKDTPDMAVGNVVGSNIFNALLIVGCAAMVAPMTITKSTVKKDLPFAVGAAVLLLVVCIDAFSTNISGNTISRIDGLLLLIGFTAFMIYTFRVAFKNKTTGTEEVPVAQMSIWKDCIQTYLVIILGILWAYP